MNELKQFFAFVAKSINFFASTFFSGNVYFERLIFEFSDDDLCNHGVVN